MEFRSIAFLRIIYKVFDGILTQYQNSVNANLYSPEECTIMQA